MTYAEYWDRLGTRNDIVDHMPYLHQVARDSRVIELGVRGGNSTAAFLSAIGKHGGHLWSCDINRPDVPEAWSDLPYWTFIPGDDLDPAVLAVMPEKADVVFIDTSHDFHHTWAELRAYAPRATRLVLVHDTQWGPSDQPLPEPTGPVAQALGAYCEEAGLTWENMPGDPGMFGLGVITK